MRRIALIIAILCISSASALQLIDARTNEPIPDSYALLRLYGDDILEIKGQTHNGKIEVPDGTYDAGIYVDRLETQGKDYYADADLPKESVTVFPTGSLTGRIVHEGIVMSDAKLTFDCEKDYGLTYPEKADKLGYFSISYIPIGKCTINAKSGNRYNYIDVQIEQGEKKEIIIELDKELEHNYILIAAILAAIAIIGIIIYRKPKTRTKQTAKQTDEKTAQKILQKKKDILTTLNKDERAIVEHLIKHNFKATQPQIYKATEIPKTTLARQIITLQNKNIVETRRVRKVKEVKLTDWFLK